MVAFTNITSAGRLAAFVSGPSAAQCLRTPCQRIALWSPRRGERIAVVPRRPRSRVSMIRGFPNTPRDDSEDDASRENLSPDVPVTGDMESPPKRALDELVDFPCIFTFKVVGIREGEFLDDISESVARVLKTEKRHLKTTFRDRGKYRSITLHAPVNSSSQIYDVYAEIDKDERVKFKF